MQLCQRKSIAERITTFIECWEMSQPMLVSYSVSFGKFEGIKTQYNFIYISGPKINKSL